MIIILKKDGKEVMHFSVDKVTPKLLKDLKTRYESAEVLTSEEYWSKYNGFGILKEKL